MSTVIKTACCTCSTSTALWIACVSPGPAACSRRCRNATAGLRCFRPVISDQRTEGTGLPRAHHHQSRHEELTAPTGILIHNHPKGNPTPSAEDRRVPMQIEDYAAPMQTPDVLDFIIVGSKDTGVHSMKPVAGPCCWGGWEPRVCDPLARLGRGA